MKKPKYQQLADLLRVDIEPMEEGQMLMTENEMISHYQSSRNTLRHAISLLREEGLVMSKAGYGTVRSQKTRIRKKSIQVVMPSRKETFWYSIMEGLFDGLSDHKEYQLVYSYGGDDATLIHDILLDALASDTVGLIYLALYEASQVTLLNKVAEKMPTVLVHNRIPGFDGAFVGTDEGAGVRRLIKYLMDCGHREIHFFSGANCSSHRERREAYLEVMDDVGLAVSLQSAGHSETEAYEFASQHWVPSLVHKGSAIVCANDYIALGVTRALKEAGWNVPEDISVTGFGGVIEGLGQNGVSLCTLDQRPFELGKQAMLALLNQFKQSQVESDIKVEGRFVVGESVANRTSGAEGSLHI
jgi:DNA-binding LacI/PurR family transcriptional regulator